MDYRSNKLLSRILKKQKTTIQSLVEMFNISERMARKLVKELNEELIHKELPEILIDKEGNIYYSKLIPQVEEQLKQFIYESDFYTYRLIPNERKTIEEMILMNAEGYVTAADISEYLETSRNTIIADLNELKVWFSENKMKLVSQVQKGYFIKGEEKDIRNGILKLLELNQDYTNYQNGQVFDIFNHLLLKELLYEDRLPQIQTIVRDEERKQNLYFSDFSFMEIVFELLILLKRVSMGKYQEGFMGESVKDSSKYPMSEHIMEQLEETFGYTIPEAEKKDFVQELRSKSYLKSSTTHIDTIDIPVMIGGIIYQISERLNISFYLDFSLYDVLVDHMKSAVYRTKLGEYLRNPFREEIERKYSEIFQIVRECIRPLEKYVGKQFQKDEISFLVMYFASMLEKDKMARIKDKKVSVMLIGGMGRGTMKLLETEIERFQDIIEIKKVKSAHDIEKVPDKEIEMIISTVSCPQLEIPVVHIQSPILKQDEIYEIQMKAMRVLEEKQEETEFENSQLEELNSKKIGKSFLTEDRIKINVNAENWEQAVTESGMILEKKGLVTKNYIKAMVDNIKVNGSYIVIYPDLAIPHAEKEQGVIEEGISFVRLKAPVQFDGKTAPVTYIVGVSVKNSDSINDMLYNLVKVFSNSILKSKLNEAKTEKEVYNLLKNKI